LRIYRPGAFQSLLSFFFFFFLQLYCIALYCVQLTAAIRAKGRSVSKVSIKENVVEDRGEEVIYLFIFSFSGNSFQPPLNVQRSTQRSF